MWTCGALLCLVDEMAEREIRVQTVFRHETFILVAVLLFVNWKEYVIGLPCTLKLLQNN